jgi:hypothetical protein
MELDVLWVVGEFIIAVEAYTWGKSSFIIIVQFCVGYVLWVINFKPMFQAWTGPESSRSLRLPDFKTIHTYT